MTSGLTLLLAFCRNPNRVISREQLLELTQARRTVERSIDVHEPDPPEDQRRILDPRTDQDGAPRRLFSQEGLSQMRVSPHMLLPRTICWQIIAFTALSAVLGNFITFAILSYQFRSEQRLHQEEAVAAIITTFAGLLAPAETPSGFSKLVAQGRAIRIAVQNPQGAARRAANPEQVSIRVLPER